MGWIADSLCQRMALMTCVSATHYSIKRTKNKNESHISLAIAIFKMPSRIKSLDKRFTLSEAERRFRKACDQIVMLNQRLGDVQKRYKMAKRSNNRSFRYNLRLKLAVIEGSRNMFYDYAYAKADQVAELRRELFDEAVEIVSGSDSDYSSDSD